MGRWIGFACLWLTACGAEAPRTASPSPAGAGAEIAVASADGAAPTCPEDEAPLDGSCFSAVGRWWFVTDMPEGRREYELVLHPDGSVRVGDEADTTPDNDEWVQRGRIVTIYMNERFVAYSATITRADELRGQGVNVRDQKWDFVMTPLPANP